MGGLLSLGQFHRPPERDGERRQFSEALDAAELRFGREHAGCGPAEGHLVDSGCFTRVAWSRTISIIDATGLVDSSVRRSLPVQTIDRKGVGQPLAKRGGGAWALVSETPGDREQVFAHPEPVEEHGEEALPAQGGERAARVGFRPWRRGKLPSLFDSHHHVHTQWAICTVVIRLARRHGIRAIRL
jgi:hypothetical protein